MNASGGSLLLLDSGSLYFRAFYGVPQSVTAPDGTPVNAVRGFLDTVARLLVEHRPTRVVACWDEDWRPAFRVAAIPTYKAHRVGADGREDIPAGLAPQVPVVVAVLEALGIARVGVPSHEADDIIGTLVARELTVADPAQEIGVVTGDRDLFQLVDDTGPVVVWYTARIGFVRVDQTALRARYGVGGGAAYADLAILRGDPSDGLPGVAGVGEKTAAALLAEHGSLEGVLAAARAHDGAMTPARRTRLLAAEDYLAAASAVVPVARDAPVGDVADALPAGPADPDALAELARRWNLASPLTRVVEAMRRIARR